MKIYIEELTQSMLNDKIFEAITKLGKPQKINYDTRRSTYLKYVTATLYYPDVDVVEGLEKENKHLKEVLRQTKERLIKYKNSNDLEYIIYDIDFTVSMIDEVLK